jgi:hypothetical protein
VGGGGGGGRPGRWGGRWATYICMHVRRCSNNNQPRVHTRNPRRVRHQAMSVKPVTGRSGIAASRKSVTVGASAAAAATVAKLVVPASSSQVSLDAFTLRPQGAATGARLTYAGGNKYFVTSDPTTLVEYAMQQYSEYFIPTSAQKAAGTAGAPLFSTQYLTPSNGLVSAQAQSSSTGASENLLVILRVLNYVPNVTLIGATTGSFYGPPTGATTPSTAGYLVISKSPVWYQLCPPVSTVILSLPGSAGYVGSATVTGGGTAFGSTTDATKALVFQSLNVGANSAALIVAGSAVNSTKSVVVDGLQPGSAGSSTMTYGSGQAFSALQTNLVTLELDSSTSKFYVDVGDNVLTGLTAGGAISTQSVLSTPSPFPTLAGKFITASPVSLPTGKLSAAYSYFLANGGTDPAFQLPAGVSVPVGGSSSNAGSSGSSGSKKKKKKPNVGAIVGGVVGGVVAVALLAGIVWYKSQQNKYTIKPSGYTSGNTPFNASDLGGCRSCPGGAEQTVFYM